jgi:UPF0755 protein
MRKYVLIIFLLLLIAGASAVIMMYNRIWRDNINASAGEPIEIYIPTGSDFSDVYQIFREMDILRDTSSFRWVAIKKNYPRHVNPGRYMIQGRPGNNKLVEMLRAGLQEPVRVVFNNIRTPEQFAGIIGEQIEPDSVDILNVFTDDEMLANNRLNRETVLGVFIPNTYEMYWNTSAELFLERMVREYRVFWNENRLSKARKIGLEPMEVMTLASIVDEESYFESEEARIAGLYVNRLKKGIRLQADPTVKYAAGDMNMTRVLRKHTQIESPYNTYRHSGLPPGPIVIPSISAIDAVLDYERHKYLYMCAREDFSGYHNFANTLSQHNKNARSYQNALNRRKIFN